MKWMIKILMSCCFTSLFIPTYNSFAAIEVIKPEFKEKIYLKIVRVIPDGFETYSLSNRNGREMTLVCAKNRYYENNKQAFIEYRNFYNEPAGHFIIESDAVCKEMGQFIEKAYSAVDEQKPFLITLNKKTMSVEKIVYPKIDPLADRGDVNDLYLKKDVLLSPKPNVFLE